MLVYLSTAYSQVEDKDQLIKNVMVVIAKLTEKYYGEKWHIVTPLFNHFILDHMAFMKSDYNYWGEYSRELLEKCDVVVVIGFPGMDLTTSVGVQDEIETAISLNYPVIYIKSEDI